MKCFKKYLTYSLIPLAFSLFGCKEKPPENLEKISGKPVSIKSSIEKYKSCSRCLLSVVLNVGGKEIPCSSNLYSIPCRGLYKNYEKAIKQIKNEINDRDNENLTFYGESGYKNFFADAIKVEKNKIIYFKDR